MNNSSLGYTGLNESEPMALAREYGGNGAAITFLGAASAAYDTNIMYHSDAFTLAMVPMFEPMDGTGAKATTMSDDGFTVKVTQFYDGINDNNLMRLDVLFGWATTYPELACKIVA